MHKKEVMAIKEISASAPGIPLENSVIGMVSVLLQKGVERGASDIHLEPVEEGLTVRLRVDGMLYTFCHISREMMPLIISRFKIMAGMDIAEKRLPQDGTIYLEDDHGDINIRVSTLPVIYGEKMVLRILNPAGMIMLLDTLGFSAHNLQKYLKFMEHAWGMVLVTGPTGCGIKMRQFSTIAIV